MGDAVVLQGCDPFRGRNCFELFPVVSLRSTTG
jgi:hypothetical protein